MQATSPFPDWNLSPNFLSAHPLYNFIPGRQTTICFAIKSSAELRSFTGLRICGASSSACSSGSFRTASATGPTCAAIRFGLDASTGIHPKDRQSFQCGHAAACYTQKMMNFRQTDFTKTIRFIEYNSLYLQYTIGS